MTENIESIYPLAPVQHGLLFHTLRAGNRLVYVEGQRIEIHGPLHHESFEESWRRAIAGHAVLRTAFVWQDLDEPLQVVRRRVSVPLVAEDWRGLDGAELEERLSKRFDEVRLAPFDLSRAPLMRLLLIRLGDERHVFLWWRHHLLVDGWSAGLILKQVFDTYDTLCRGGEAETALARPFSDYIAWLRNQDHADTERAWRRELGSFLAPPDGYLPHTADGTESGVHERSVMLSKSATQTLEAFARHHRVTLNTLVQGAWALLLRRNSSDRDIVFGVAVSGRSPTFQGIDSMVGVFVNTLPARVHVEDDERVATWLQRIQTRQMELRQYEYAPLAEIQKWSGTPSGVALFDSIVVFDNPSMFARRDARHSSVKIQEMIHHRSANDYPITVGAGLVAEQLVLRLAFQRECFDAPSTDRVLTQLSILLVGLAQLGDEARLVDVPMIDARERHRVLVEWNRTAAQYPQDRCLHELFEAQVQRTPEAVAVWYEGRQVSYRELNARANRVAHYLRGLGVGPDVVVGLCVERSAQMVVGLFGILKAGGAYLPLDAGYPTERLGYLLGDAAPRVVLTQQRYAPTLVEQGARVVCLDADEEAIESQADTDVAKEELGLSARNLAYVIYTSGSSGRPKGVMVEHRSIANYCHQVVRELDLERSGGALVATPIGFDLSLTGLLPPLLCGQWVKLCEEGNELQALRSALEEGGELGLLKLTPSHVTALRQLTSARSLRTRIHNVVMGGESLKASTVQWWRDSGAIGRVFNHYGPTETTVGCVMHEVTEPTAGAMPIGRPIGNVKIYVLDEYQQPVPLGVAGELYIGGVGVARGYLNRPELTAERFVADPYAQEPGERMYRTGDLARYRADGNLEFLGRNDFQVKVRGFRIELGEIEAQLTGQAGVAEAVVVVRGEEAAEQRLVAYYTRTTDVEEISASGLRGALAKVLPEHMVPSAYVELTSLPLTANGKLDRKALPEPGQESLAASRYEPPQGETEELLAGIWSEVLKVERVGRHDNFFELGGHSLLAVTVIERMRQVGLHADVGALFTTPTLAALAAAVGGGSEPIESPPNGIPGDCEAITPPMLPLVELTQEEIERIVATVPGGAANVQDIYPLAPLQEGMLFHHLMGEQRDPYLQWSLFSFDGRERLDRFIEALRAVIARHDILRTAVLWEGLREPVQVVWRRAALAVEQLELASGNAEERLRERVDPSHYRLDIRQAPLMRLFIAEGRSEGRWVLLWLVHHLAGDRATAEVLRREIGEHMLGCQSQLPAPLPFRNFVVQARRGVSREEHEAFFKEMLGDVDEPTVPFGLSDVHGDGSAIEEARLEVSGAVAQRLRSCARRLGVSVASLCHLAFGRVLCETSRRDDVVFGTVVFGRMQGGEGADRVPGLFINTLPLRLQVDQEGAAASVRTVHERLAELMRHEHAPLALAQRCSGVAAPTPLFTALLNYRHGEAAARSPEESPAADGIRFLGLRSGNNYPFTVDIDDLGDTIALFARVQSPLDPKRICGYMNRVLEELVEALEEEPQKPLRELQVLPEEERREVLVEWNRTAAQYPQDRCLHELFEAQVQRTPEAVAVWYEGRQVSYRELNARANRVAHYLRGLGVGPDVVVGLCVERSAQMVVGLFGILKAGGAYLPLDAGYPTERLGYLLGDAAPRVVLTQQRYAPTLVEQGARVVCLDADEEAIESQADTDVAKEELGLSARNLAYVIYTSGSSGRPKGVMVEHRSIANYCHQVVRELDLERSGGALVATPIGFDLSLTGLLPPLLCGQWVKLCEEGNELQALRSALEEGGELGLLKLTPSHVTALRQLTSARSLRTRIHNVVMGGESLKASTVQWWRDSGAIGRVFNHYGPTETTVGCVMHEVTEPTAGAMPIGRPIGNVKIYVLDEYQQPVPLGVAGELYIGGVGVARGYLNRPELTAERFVADPYAQEPGERMYRTGDLARYRADGNLEFLGRNDFQVKVRGFRIELGEIEAQLTGQAGVAEAVVVVRGEEAAEQRLVAYYTRTTDVEEISASGLRGALAKVLPEHMVPSAYVELTSLPLTANGKLDRKALPEPGQESLAASRYEPPQGETEELLAGIWSEVLKVERVGRHDNFFELGGHSLFAVRVISRMRQANLHADVRALLVTPTLAALAAAVGGGSEPIEVPPNGIPGDCEAITPPMLPLVDLSEKEIERIVATVPGGAANVQDIYPLAPLQEGMLFHHLMGEQRDPYLQWSLFSFDGRERLDRFIEALRAVIARHDILRTAVLWEGLREPVQVVWRRAALAVEQLELASGNAEERLRERVDPSHYRLDIRQAPLIRLFFAEDRARGRWLLLWLRHHLLGDHTTDEVIQREIIAHLFGRESELRAPLPFRNFVVQARRGVSREEHEAFFKEMLGDVDEPTVPFGLADVRGDGSKLTAAWLELDVGVAQRLRSCARQLRVSMASLCHLAFGRVLAQASGRDDVVFGTVLFGRMQGGEGSDRMPGLFINTLPLRLHVNEEGAAVSVRAVHEHLAELMRHEHAPLALVQRCSSVPAPGSLFSALLNYRYGWDIEDLPSTAKADLLAGIEFRASEERTNYPLSMAVNDVGEQLSLTAFVQAPLQPERICGYMERVLKELVEALEREPHKPVRELRVLPEEERRELVVEWNRTARSYPADRCVHELFEEQVRRSPEAVALVGEGEKLTYREVNERANRLARYLRGRGVRAGEAVPVVMARSVRMVVSELAVLKCGAAYVPIDPEYPAQRQRWVMEDCGAKRVLGGEALPGFEGGAQWLDVGELGEELERESSEDLGVKTDPRAAAYVMYTSGSTGRPKGVVVEHGAVNARVVNGGYVEIVPEDCVAHCSSGAFDASTFEVWSGLLNGARVLIVPARVVLEPQELAQVLREGGVTVLHLTTELFNRYAVALGGVYGEVRYLLFGGEASDPRRVREVLERSRPKCLKSFYGPTETTAFAAAVQIERVEEGAQRIPIGRPIGNTHIYVLDGEGEPVPVGVTGELYIGGAGVARGYLNRPELTAERFVPDAYGEEPGARLYRTGDLARYRADGNLEFLGRNDFQVKVRGFRIELGEIEAQLRRHPRVRDAVVLAHDDVPEEKRLTAYVCPASKAELWPSIAEFFVYDEFSYGAMAAHDARNRCYSNAFSRALAGATVLEVGPGPHVVLSRLAVEAGARKVYAVELLADAYQKARDEVARLGLEDRITVIHGDAATIELPEQVDYCISEIVGNIGGAEAAAHVSNHVRRLLSKPENVIPRRSVTKIAAVSLTDDMLEYSFNEVAAKYVERIFEQAGRPFDLRVSVKDLPLETILSSTGVFEDLDFTTLIPAETDHDISLVFEKRGKMTGFLVWLTLSVDDVEFIDTLTNAGSWLPIYVPVFDEGEDVDVGACLSARIMRRPCDDGIHPDFFIEGVLTHHDGRTRSLKCDVRHQDTRFRGSGFYRKLFRNGDVPVQPRLAAPELRAHLESLLPAHMVPSAFVTLDALPLTTNGKLDRKALPPPGDDGWAARAYEAPEGEIERRLAAIWAEILRLERVGRQDNFFELGGHSLLAVSLVERMRQSGLDASVEASFNAPTLAALASITKTVREIVL